jgi:uncharacterized membrane protein required for colicin V production
VSYATLRKIGLPEASASLMADKIADSQGGVAAGLSGAISDKLCSALAYIAVFGIAFLLISIIFTVVGNVLNLVFKIPGIELVDSLIGMGFGLLKGLVVVFVITMIIRYLGLLAPDVIDKTTLLDYIVNKNPLADILGI